MWTSLFVLVALGQTPAAQPTTPAGCVTAARQFALTQQRALKQVTAETVRQIEVEKVAMAQRCAAQFSATTLAEADLPDLIALYGESAQPVLAKAALDRALTSRTLPIPIRAEVLAQAVATGLRDEKSAARNARLEQYVDELDRLELPGDALLDVKMATHSRMNGYYRGDDIDDGIIKHSTWLIERGKTFTTAQRSKYGSHIVSAHINMAEALAGRGQTPQAQALLASARTGWSDVSNADRMLDPVIARYALVGTVGAPITAPRWLNAPANTTMPMTGAVTLLEFTAHWCVPCKESYPGLKRLLAKYSPQGFRVVLATELYGYFAMERPLTPEVEFERDRDYWANAGLAVPIAVADQRSAVDNPNDAAYKVGGIPQIHLLDRQGRIRLIMVGYDDANEPFLASLIEKLLRER
jgi:thiol-disulfide isomerase/thioredoxin